MAAFEPDARDALVRPHHQTRRSLMPPRFHIYVAAVLVTLVAAQAGGTAEIPCAKLPAVAAEKLFVRAYPEFKTLRFVDGVACEWVKLPGRRRVCEWEY